MLFFIRKNLNVINDTFFATVLYLSICMLGNCSCYFSFFYNFIFPSQHASHITCINIYNSLKHGLYLHTVFEFLCYIGGGCSAPVIMGPIAHVVHTALECTRLHVPV